MTPTKKNNKKPALHKGFVEIPLPPVTKISLPPDTTAEEDVNTAGQRRVNLIWEITQAVIAIIVTSCTMIKAMVIPVNSQVPTILAVAFGTVVGFYFSRTNHQAIGGVGKKPLAQEYKGR